MECKPVKVEKVTIENTLNYKGISVLHYKIEYPKFSDPENQKSLECINDWYKKQAENQRKEFKGQYFKEATEQYEFSIKNQYPFHMYEALTVYEITYNQDCIISLYTDTYIFSGGAHGNTVRSSDTWNAACGCRYTLFGEGKDTESVKKSIMKQINEQIRGQMESGDNWYFDNYSELVAQTFNPDSFYLTPDGMVIYFQQYDIAPYSSGIPEFTVYPD